MPQGSVPVWSIATNDLASSRNHNGVVGYVQAESGRVIPVTMRSR